MGHPNEAYAAMAADYWAARGHDAGVRVTDAGEITSNLIAAPPPGYVGDLRKARWYTKGDKRPDRRRVKLRVVR